MKKYQDFQSAVADKADAKSLATYIVNTIAAYADNDVVPFDFLDSDSVGMFSKALAMKRNWATMTFDAIAPDTFGVNVVPQEEADIFSDFN